MSPLLQITGSLRPLALILALLTATAARPVQDSSGGHFAGKDVSTHSASSNPDLERCRNLAKNLHDEASNLKKKMCESQNMCDNSSEVLAENNLIFPNLTEEDRCFLSGFNKETCLIKLVSSLKEFDTYLQYMENETEDKMRSGSHKLRLGTEQLGESLKLSIKVADAVPVLNPNASKNLLSELKSLKDWSRKVALRHILWHYTYFMEQTIRAIRHMIPKNVNA